MNVSFDKLKIAVVYDHLTTKYGGAELVLKQLLKIFPKAELFTTVFDIKVVDWIDQNRIHSTWLQNLGPLKRFHQLLVPFHPVAIEQLNLSKFDLIISVSAGTAKGILTMPGQLHVCYLLTPPRYFQMNKNEFTNYIHSLKLDFIPGFKSIASPIFKYLQKWDHVAAWRPDKVITISNLVSERVESQYNRSSDKVIYPPFITKESAANQSDSTFLLSFSRLSSYKRIDLSIKAALKTNRLLVVAGNGPAKHGLQSMASNQGYIRSKSQSVENAIENSSKHNKNIVFVGSCSELEKEYLFSHCQALLMPGIEDFGLIGLEAASYGKPVITHGKSGIAEVLTSPSYAIHIVDQKVSTLAAAILNMDKIKFDSNKIQKYSKNFDQKHFTERLLNTLYQFWSQHSTISS